MTETPQYQLRDDLIALGDLKVWSVLVTIVGDQTREPGGFLPGPALSRITTSLTIRPEAHRVALHRLRKDGWITVTNDGRISLYALTDYGRVETKSVQGRGYAATVERSTHCTLILTAPNADPLLHTDCIGIGEQSYLTEQTLRDLPQTLCSKLRIAELADLC